MDSTVDTPTWIALGESATPVILPLPGTTDVRRETHGEGKLHFEFPELSCPHGVPPAMQSPRVIWPECDCTETARACAALAQNIHQRLAPNRPTTLAMTSPNDGDGKTRVLLNLAPVLARHIRGGVLAVDGCFSKPDLTARLSMPTSHMDSALIYSTNLSGLSVLPTYPRPEGRIMDANWLENLQDGWSLVVVDMPSLEHGESLGMIRHCDGVCLVVRLGHTTRRAVTEANRVIHRVGSRLFGCIVVG